MIYPRNFEEKIGFNEIRTILKRRCMSSLGKEKVDEMAFTQEIAVIHELLQQTKDFRLLQEEHDDFPLNYFFDVRESVARLRLEGTHMEEEELFDLKRSLETIIAIVKFLRNNENDDLNDDDDDNHPYPSLYRLTEGIVTFPQLVQRIDQILDKFGKIKDTASTELARIRKELAKMEGSVSRTLYNILRTAQSEGLVEKDTTPTLRDGRLVIPIAPNMKRRISGIVHDESASGKTLFIEPTEVVEANNHIRELEHDERKEIIRILTDFANDIRPHISDIIASYKLLAEVDFIRAKVEMGNLFQAIEPIVKDYPHIDWIRAIHPLLQQSLAKQDKQVVPLEIVLRGKEQGARGKERLRVGERSSEMQGARLLVISGPNAGGKSVCLKTVGLLQYMLQCGLPIPVSERSTCGIFDHIMMDIGDEQSIENDLSTYSSHLLNMKNMMKQANDRTLLLIDEFGTGTEPTIGGAIAEAVLKQFCKKKAWGVITTHYQNLKHFADEHEGVVNGAMLYDRKEMRALFQLAIGRPGSSFAIEIARKTGIPEEVIKDAADIVGTDYIQSDKYLQDIVRDKRYWENKRQTIHQHEKRLEVKGEKLEADLQEIDQERKAILRRAKEQAEELLQETNKRIENAIREIRESQAEKEETRRIREELNAFSKDLADIDTKAEDEKIARKIKQIQERKERREKRKKEKEQEARSKHTTDAQKPTEKVLQVGDTVRIKGLTSVGTIEAIDGKNATVIFGGMRTKMRAERLERTTPTAAKTEGQQKYEDFFVNKNSQMTRNTIDEHRNQFKQDIDVRGMRADEALNQVQYFIDDAILVGVGRVRILHGKGNGILRQLIRQYLQTIPNVSGFRDEHVQFGGAGITVVDIA